MTALTLNARLGAAETAVAETLSQLTDTNIAQRIREHDHTVWREDPEEISNRLGWLDIAHRLRNEVQRLTTTLASAQAAGFTDVLLLGMGGSSLAPEVFASVFGGSALRLNVVDSTDPDMVRDRAGSVDLEQTLFIVATKSGGTVETLSAFKYFYNRVMETAGDKAGQQFIAITDPGSKLVTLAEKYHFREVYLNDPNIGGRYSALSFFGLVAAALVGVDVGMLLDRAIAESERDRGLQFGAVLGALYQQGRDKLTIVASDSVASFADWSEQLVAESTGKNGEGILPVAGEPLLGPEHYGDDRIFVNLRLADDSAYTELLYTLAEAGHPVITFELEDTFDLGAQIWLWEMATAVAGHLLDIQPFDQPNVESAKVQARKMQKAYQESGKLPEMETAVLSADALHDFLAEAEAGDYISLQAYVNPTTAVDAELRQLRADLLVRYKVATTLGYGPRFLHSTGQLHKGDDGSGLFVQFTSDPKEDIAIPEEAGKDASSISFGVLIKAQALGDAQALKDENRRFIRFHLGQDAAENIGKLRE